MKTKGDVIGIVKQVNPFIDNEDKLIDFLGLNFKDSIDHNPRHFTQLIRLLCKEDNLLEE